MDDHRINVPRADWEIELNKLRNKKKSDMTVADLTPVQREQILAARSGSNPVPWHKLSAWFKDRYEWGSKDQIRRLYDELAKDGERPKFPPPSLEPKVGEG